jgi:hypothetical protein
VETKGKTLEEIDALFEGEKHSSVPNIELLRRGEKELDADLVKEQLNADIQLAKVGNSQPSHRLHNLSDFWAGEYQETVQVTGYHDLVSPEGGTHLRIFLLSPNPGTRIAMAMCYFRCKMLSTSPTRWFSLLIPSCVRPSGEVCSIGMRIYCAQDHKHFVSFLFLNSLSS